MPPTEKAKIVLEAKDKATKDLKKVRREFGKLVGAIAAGNVAANLADKALGSLTKGLGQLVDATKVAARIQVLNRVVKLTGTAAGISAIALEDNKNAIINLGIAEQEALQIQQRFIQVQLDIADAVKIARVAQDLAVIAGTNSSDTALQLTDALVKQKPILLKQFGIIADLNVIYGKQAEALGKTVDQLDKTEKRQAFLNEILEQSKTVAGAYESAMKDVGKRLTSLPRHVQNAQNAIGQLFIPVLGAAVDGAADFLKTLTILGNSLNISLPKAVQKSASALRGFAETKKDITALLDEYTSLVTKTALNEKEHQKLDTVIKELGKTLPDAVTQWNEYGEAVAISAEAVERLVTQQENVLRANFIQNVGRLRTEFKELGQVDLSKVAEKMAVLAKERDRLAQIEKGARILELSPQKWIDPLADVNRKIGRLNELLMGTSEGKRDIIALASTMYPDLKAGTEDYANALTFMKSELFEAVLAHQKQFAAQKESSEGGEEAIDILERNLVATEEYVIGLETIDGKLLLVKKSFLAVAEALPDTSSALFQAPFDYAEAWELSTDEIETDIAEYTTFAITASGNVTTAVVANIQRQGVENDRYSAQVSASIRAERDKRMRLAAEMGRMAVNTAGRITRALLDGRKDMSDIFKGMAQDFIAFFVEQALLSLLNVFIPGLGTLLGGIFDTPANDRMAMQQGEHFAQWFTRGALENLRHFPTDFAGVAAGSLSLGGIATSFPGIQSPGAGGGGGVILQFNNPIMTQSFVEDDVVDILERTSRDGLASLVLDDSNLTGQDDGIIF